jgi:S-adenosylmethionine decarboxylase proenzyme
MREAAAVAVPGPIGKHCVITVRNIPDPGVLERIETIKPLLELIIRECDLHVVGEAFHQFSPIGATYVYVLEESHMSIHTYPELQSCYMDIFCCSQEFEPEKAIQVIRTWFNIRNEDMNWTVLIR